MISSLTNLSLQPLPLVLFIGLNIQVLINGYHSWRSAAVSLEVSWYAFDFFSFFLCAFQSALREQCHPTHGHSSKLIDHKPNHKNWSSQPLTLHVLLARSNLLSTICATRFFIVRQIAFCELTPLMLMRDPGTKTNHVANNGRRAHPHLVALTQHSCTTFHHDTTHFLRGHTINDCDSHLTWLTEAWQRSQLFTRAQIQA